MGPGSMRNAWTRHRSVVKLEDPFFLRHFAACRTKRLLRDQARRARLTNRRSSASNPALGKIPTAE